MSNKHIEADCMAEVIGGVLGPNSPNLGLIVKVIRYEGDDNMYGPIWLCDAKYAEGWATQEGAVPRDEWKQVPPGTLHFAEHWLRRIPDDDLKTMTKTTEEITA